MIQHMLRAAMLCALFFLTAASDAAAAPQTIEAEGIYVMGDNDSPTGGDALGNRAGGRLR